MFKTLPLGFGNLRGRDLYRFAQAGRGGKFVAGWFRPHASAVNYNARELNKVGGRVLQRFLAARDFVVARSRGQELVVDIRRNNHQDTKARRKGAEEYRQDRQDLQQSADAYELEGCGCAVAAWPAVHCSGEKPSAVGPRPPVLCPACRA